MQNVLWNTSRYNKYFAEFFLLMVLSKMFAMTQFICPVNFQLLHHIPVYKISMQAVPNIMLLVTKFTILLCQDSKLHQSNVVSYSNHHDHNHFTALFLDHPDEPVPEENFWALWRKGRLTEADRHTNHLAGRHSIRTKQCPPPPSPIFYRPDALPAAVLPNQQCQSIEGKKKQNHCD